ncbi:MAG: hypothetical protein RTU09_00885 [Candidatus Thorarchaeota archaeon]
MPSPEFDEESIPRYMRGFEWFSHMTRTTMSERPWKRLGLISFYDAPYAESERLYLSPKQVMVSMAAQAKTKNHALVFVVDSMEKGEMGLSTKAGFDQFIEIFDGLFPDSRKFYFGAKDSERSWLHEYSSLKIPTEWLIGRPNVFAEVLSDASPIGENIRSGDAAFEDIAGMIEVLVEKIGPPSLTEEVLGKIRGTEASEYAGEAAGLLAAFVNPAIAVTRGVKYLGKFMDLVKDRRRQEVKDVYKEWTERVTSGYSEENLTKFFEREPESMSEFLDGVTNLESVLLITETRGTLYDLFLPLVLQHLVEQIGYIPPHRRPRRESELVKADVEEEWDDQSMSYEDLERIEDIELPPVTDQLIQTVIDKQGEIIRAEIEISEDEFEGKPETILFLDAVTHLTKFRRSSRFALNIPEKFPNMTVAASFFTDRENVSNALAEGILDYMSERALVFDIQPGLFDLVTANMPVSKKAWLQMQLQEMEKLRSDGGVAFLEYYRPSKGQWELRSVEKPDTGVLGEIRSWFRRGS